MKKPNQIQKSKTFSLSTIIYGLLMLLPPFLSRSQVTPAPEATPEEEKIEELDPFDVVSQRAEGYGVTTLTTATRLNTPIRDIPTTISVVTSDFMKDIAAVDFRDAIAYTPALSPRQNVPDGSKIRGLRTFRSYQDNVRFPIYESDMVNIDHIEIIKGPASAITGRGEPGGVINYVTKKPTREKETTFRFRTGSDDFFRGEVDQSGPINADKGMYYRAIITAQNNDLWRDFETQDKIGFYPSFYWEINKKTNILFSAELYKSDFPATFGPINFTVSTTERALRGDNPTAEQYLAAGIEPNSWQPKSFQAAEPGSERENQVANGSIVFNHRFNKNLSFRQAFVKNFVRSEIERSRISNVFQIADQDFIDSGVIEGVSLGDVILPRSFQRQVTQEKFLSLQGDLLWEWTMPKWAKVPVLANSKHKTLFSYEYTDQSLTNFQRRGNLAPLDFNNPIYGAQPTDLNITTNRKDYTTTNAYFVTQQSSFLDDRVVFVYGYRYDDLSTDRSNDITGSRVDTSTDPNPTKARRWGVTIHPLPWLSLYHVNSNQKDPAQTTFKFLNLPPDDPRSNEEITFARSGLLQEYGVKAELFKGRVSFTWANFQIEQSGFLRNTQEQDLATGAIFTRNFLVEGSVFEGYELEFFGNPIKNLIIFGGYSRISTTTSADPTQVEQFGKRLSNRGVPLFKTTMFIRYNFYNSDGNGPYLKGGFQVLGKQWSSLENATLLPRNARGDIGFGYKWKNYTLDVQINNVTDAVNPLATVAPGSNTVGPPLQWFLTLTAKY